uniref:F-box domain-containing protein n=1 Tax=Ditylenchus dipsaci TaxID=166011 RepID=A0A915DX91_9BILA
MLPAETFEQIVGFMNLNECQKLIILSTSVYDVFHQRMEIAVENWWLQLPKKVSDFGRTGNMSIPLREAIDKLKALVAQLCKPEYQQEHTRFDGVLTTMRMKMAYLLYLLGNNQSIFQEEVGKAKALIDEAIGYGNINGFEFDGKWSQMNMTQKTPREQLKMLSSVLKDNGFTQQSLQIDAKLEIIEEHEIVLAPLIRALEKSILGECDTIKFLLDRGNPVVSAASNTNYVPSSVSNENFEVCFPVSSNQPLYNQFAGQQTVRVQSSQPSFLNFTGHGAYGPSSDVSRSRRHVMQNTIPVNAPNYQPPYGGYMGLGTIRDAVNEDSRVYASSNQPLYNQFTGQQAAQSSSAAQASHSGFDSHMFLDQDEH